ncbi:unnamed protein product [Protopolystoma xenopodis]|uniref:Uncharacterized protein n=1 Tax=Protopolystoma xenopodis TaxID=117903 RepID=A0A448XIZ9_9PLAT|nr:unnamed protein product [Protopolystoma xenopodis]
MPTSPTDFPMTVQLSSQLQLRFDDGLSDMTIGLIASPRLQSTLGRIFVQSALKEAVNGISSDSYRSRHQRLRIGSSQSRLCRRHDEQNYS